jgi:signal peptidase II
MTLHQSIPVLGRDFFRLTYVENRGIAFGLSFGNSILLTIITIGAVFFLIYYIVRMRNSHFAPRMAMAFILGGALGNLCDRFFRGQVVDFLDFDFPDFIMSRWPIINLADSSVTIGMTILIVYLLFFDKPQKNPSLEEPDHAPVRGDNFRNSPTPESRAD